MLVLSWVTGLPVWVVILVTLFVFSIAIYFSGGRRSVALPLDSPFDLSHGVLADSSDVCDSSGHSVDDVGAITYALLVRNNRPDATLLRNVRATIWLSAPDVVRLNSRETSSPAVDLQHGDIAAFEIGNVFVTSNKLSVMARGGHSRVSTQHPDSITHNAKHNHLSLQVANELGEVVFGCGGGADAPPFTLPISITADDVVSQTVLIEIDLSGDNQAEWVRLKTDDRQINGALRRASQSDD